MQLRSNLWFTDQADGYFGKGRIELLEKIHKTGSISKAAKEMKMSYKAAWDAINDMNKLSEEPIVKRETGGKGGGGTVLTPKGLEYIKIYKKLDQAQILFFNALGHYAKDIEKLEAFTSKLTLRTSARNQLLGRVTGIKHLNNNAEVLIKIAEDIEVSVMITAKSLKDLDIQKNNPISILLKSTWITLFKTLPSIQQTKNYLHGKVSAIQEDDENSEITVALSPQSDLIASVPNQVKKDLALQTDDEVWAVFDATSALLAV